MNKLLILFLILLLPSALKGQDLIRLTNAPSPISVSKQFKYFIDSTSTLNYENVLEKGNFAHSAKEVPNYGVVTRGTIWAVAYFTTSQNQKWYLNLEPTANNNVYLFQKKRQSKWVTLLQGMNIDPDSNSHSVNHNFFKLFLDPGDTTLVLLKIKDYFPISLALSAGPIESFIKPFHNTDFYFSIGFGIIMMMFLYNAFLCLTQKRKVYFYYSLYALFSLINAFQISGFSHHFPIPVKTLIHYFPTSNQCLSSIFSILFTLELFKGYVWKPLRYSMLIYIAVLVLIIISGAFVPAESFSIMISLSFFMFLFNLSAGFYALRKENRSAKFYLSGFGVFYLTAIYIILSINGVVPSGMTPFLLLNLGLSIEMIMLSFAVGDKMKSFLQEKEKAQQIALDQAMENERIIREQNIILEEKVNERTHLLSEANEELNQQNEEITAQYEEIERQKLLVDTHRKEIIESITYAKRIQNTILPSAEELTHLLPAVFILYKPKDIVSGDFYFAHEKNESIIFGVADCTGHGVPGSLVSMVGYNALMKAINENKLLKPGEILDNVSLQLEEIFSKKVGSEIRDGMDIALCRLDKANMLLEYAGANNPLILIRENQLIEFKPNKQPVGFYEFKKTFDNHVIELKENDFIYLFSDGFADQFGGENEKKFKASRFKELLLSIQSESMDAQQRMLNETFETWKAGIEQVDDVTIMGIKI